MTALWAIAQCSLIEGYHLHTCCHENLKSHVLCTMFRAVFWVVLPCKYNPEDSSEHHTRRRENLKSRYVRCLVDW
jgi:hypothetical protein